eukprot:8268548-Pyramimonas_sp.AAC.1
MPNLANPWQTLVSPCSVDKPCHALLGPALPSLARPWQALLNRAGPYRAFLSIDKLDSVLLVL